MILTLIISFSLLSYFVGVRAVLAGDYKPNIYSRIIWFLLALNGLAGVTHLQNDQGIIILSLIQTLGSLLILVAALKHAVYSFGKVEIISTILLGFSGVVWLAGDFPFLNVVISLVAHFIGGIPTIARVYKTPSSENIPFWALFGIASFISFATASKIDIKDYMFPLYFALFNTSIILLASRKRHR